MTTPRGEKRHLVSLQGPGARVLVDGEWTDGAPVALDPPQMYAQILPATARSLERVTAGAAISSASHIITLDFHDGVDTQTQVLFEDRTFYVRGVANPEERDIELVLVCEELVT